MHRCTPQLRPQSLGFSLLEMVAVLMVIAVALAVAAPSLSGFAEGRRTTDTARSLTALAGWARSQAVSEGRMYRLHVDVDARQYFVTAETGGTFEPVESTLGQPVDLPDRVTVTWEEPEQVREAGYVTFYPTGRLTPATLLLEEASGIRTRVRAVSVTDRFAVVSSSGGPR
ncbi:MAG: GspH/FimT family pseudopilin [Phycisphaeraceae bacterium]